MSVLPSAAISCAYNLCPSIHVFISTKVCVQQFLFLIMLLITNKSVLHLELCVVCGMLANEILNKIWTK